MKAYLTQTYGPEARFEAAEVPVPLFMLAYAFAVVKLIMS